MPSKNKHWYQEWACNTKSDRKFSHEDLILQKMSQTYNPVSYDKVNNFKSLSSGVFLSGKRYVHTPVRFFWLVWCDCDKRKLVIMSFFFDLAGEKETNDIFTNKVWSYVHACTYCCKIERTYKVVSFELGFFSRNYFPGF